MTNWTARKNELEERLSELERNLHSIEDRLEEPHTRDFEDFATEQEETEVLEGLGNVGLKEIQMIRFALKRIEDGNYGFCQKCGNDILKQRLDLVPYTPLCRHCANGKPS